MTEFENAAPIEPQSAARPRRTISIVRDALGAFAYGLSAMGAAISMAVLIFTGPLAPGLPRAIAAFVIAGGLASAYIGWKSRFDASASILQDGPAIVMVAVAAVVGANGDASSIVDVFVLLGMTTLSTGLLMWLLGRFRLGGLVRYVPTTVVAAFMAGTGWLLVKGGVDAMVGRAIGLGDIADLLTRDLARFWVPGVIFGLAIWAIGRSDRIPVVAMGASIVGSLAAFYVVVLAVSSVSAVEEGGWLVGSFPGGSGPSIVTPGELADADWGRILSQFAGIVSVVAVSILSLLLNVTGLGTTSSERPDVDAELRAAGVANLVCGPLGATPTFHGLADTLLLKQLGAERRVVPIAAGFAMAAFGAIGVGLIGYVPRLIVGGLLIAIGTGLLVDWVRGLVRSVSKIEQLMSIGIVLTIAAAGILEGIAVGLVAACAVFIVRYSRVDPIRLTGSGHDMRSRVDRVPAEVAALGERANRLAVFELQGYLFFGSVTSLDDRIRGLTDADVEPLDVLVLDFRTVTGIDTSGYELIGQVAQHVARAGTKMVMSSVERDLQESLASSEPEALIDVTWAATLDEALEASERQQLEASGLRGADGPDASSKLSSELLAEFEERTHTADTVVFEQGARSDGMFVVVEGSMTAFRVDESGVRHRLRRFGPAAMVGEIGLITQGRRSAEIVAESDAVVMWLSTTRYRALRQEHPELAFELNDYIMRGQAARVVSLSEGLARSSR